jgi:peroxiredoxin
MLLLSVSSVAQNYKKFGIEKNDSIPVGIAVGKQAPKIEVWNAAGEQVNPISGTDQYHVVVFYRGNWCSHCNRYLSNLNDSLGAIRRAGGQVIAITPEPIDELSNMEGADKIKRFADPQMKTIQAFDSDFVVTERYQHQLLEANGMQLAVHNDQRIAQLPVPATYVIAPSGEIIFRHFDYDYTERAQVRDIIDNINSHRD